jgi:two-component system chemotaxis response regulator CheY
MIELQNMHICLVEPSGLQANIIVNHLNKVGVTQIDKVTKGAEALASLESEVPPDAIMSAMYLPDMTGTELIHSIRKHESQSSTPFVLISSETNPYNLEDVRQAGAVAILPKPFIRPQLLSALNNTLDFLNAEEEREEEPELNYTNMKVLIVDDSKVARRHIRNVLERIGLEDFTEVADGQEAIPLIDSVLYDLVVTDYNMPNVDGLALVDYIRNKSVQGSVPILMVSSVSDENRLAAVMEAGVSAIFDKPFEISSVRKYVRQLLSSES